MPESEFPLGRSESMVGMEGVEEEYERRGSVHSDCRWVWSCFLQGAQSINR